MPDCRMAAMPLLVVVLLLTAACARTDGSVATALGMPALATSVAQEPAPTPDAVRRRHEREESQRRAVAWIRERVPPALREARFAGDEAWQWLLLAVLLPAALLVAWFLRSLLTSFLASRLRRQPEREEDVAALRHAIRPFTLTVSVVRGARREPREGTGDPAREASGDARPGAGDSQGPARRAPRDEALTPLDARFA